MGAAEKKFEDKQPERNGKQQSGLWQWVRFIVFIAFIFFFFKYAVGITIVSGHSMAPTIEDKDILFSIHLLYKPEKEDLIILRDEHGYDVIKRLIAFPGDTVEIEDGVVLVNGQPLEESYSKGTSNDMERVAVPEGSYFVLGDNRTPGESLDSRHPEVGPIKEDAIKGEIIFSLLPFKLSFQ